MIERKKRLQLTLFINEDENEEIEKVRKIYNPLQYELIKSHITLCREDELENFEKCLYHLSNLQFDTLELSKGTVQRFSDGKGVLFNILDDGMQLKRLRQKILNGMTKDLREIKPHITLMHPRNSTCTDLLFEEINRYHFPDQFHFNTIRLIEQADNDKWIILQEFSLKSF